MKRILMMTIFAAYVAACGSNETEYANEGAAQVVPAGDFTSLRSDQPVSIEADQELEVFVSLESCASCAEEISASCEARVDGDRIEITASGRVEHTSAVFGCNDACYGVQATCVLGTLPAGEYSVNYAGATETLSIPTDDSPVVGEVP